MGERTSPALRTQAGRSLDSAHAFLKAETPEIVLIADDLPEARALTLLRALVPLWQGPYVPPAEHAARIAEDIISAQAGFDDVWQRSIDPRLALARARVLLRRSTHATMPRSAHCMPSELRSTVRGGHWRSSSANRRWHRARPTCLPCCCAIRAEWSNAALRSHGRGGESAAVDVTWRACASGWPRWRTARSHRAGPRPRLLPAHARDSRGSVRHRRFTAGPLADTMAASTAFQGCRPDDEGHCKSRRPGSSASRQCPHGRAGSDVNLRRDAAAVGPARDATRGPLGQSSPTGQYGEVACTHHRHGRDDSDAQPASAESAIS